MRFSACLVLLALQTNSHHLRQRKGELDGVYLQNTLKHLGSSLTGISPADHSSGKDLVASVSTFLDPGGCLAQVMYAHEVGEDEDDYGFVPDCKIGGVESMTCLSGSSSAQLADGQTKPVSSLVLTDVLDTGVGSFPSRILYWLHKDASARANWTRINSFPLASLVLSPRHLVLGRRATSKRTDILDEREIYPLEAFRIRPNEYQLWHQQLGQWINVTSTESYQDGSEGEGVYAPVTASGRLVIDGVLVSSYSRLPNLEAAFTHTDSHTMAHFLTAPLRLFYRLPGATALSTQMQQWLRRASQTPRLWTSEIRQQISCAPRRSEESIACQLARMKMDDEPNWRNEVWLELMRLSLHKTLISFWAVAESLTEAKDFLRAIKQSYKIWYQTTLTNPISGVPASLSKQLVNF